MYKSKANNINELVKRELAIGIAGERKLGFSVGNYAVLTTFISPPTFYYFSRLPIFVSIFWKNMNQNPNHKKYCLNQASKKKT